MIGSWKEDDDNETFQGGDVSLRGRYKGGMKGGQKSGGLQITAESRGIFTDLMSCIESIDHVYNQQIAQITTNPQPGFVRIRPSPHLQE